MALGYPSARLGSTRVVTTVIVIAVIIVVLLVLAGLLLRSRRPDVAQRRVESRARQAEADRLHAAAEDGERTVAGLREQAGEEQRVAEQHARRAREAAAEADRAEASARERREAAAAHAERAREIDPDA
jgi:hypothetical protein